MTLSERLYESEDIQLDLNTARSDTAQGLTKKINTLTVISLGGGALSFKLNSATGDEINAVDGLKIEGIPITDIYYTNAAQAGLTAEIFIAWVD